MLCQILFRHDHLNNFAFHFTLRSIPLEPGLAALNLFSPAGMPQSFRLGAIGGGMRMLKRRDLGDPGESHHGFFEHHVAVGHHQIRFQLLLR